MSGQRICEYGSKDVARVCREGMVCSRHEERARHESKEEIRQAPVWTLAGAMSARRSCFDRPAFKTQQKSPGLFVTRCNPPVHIHTLVVLAYYHGYCIQLLSQPAKYSA